MRRLPLIILLLVLPAGCARESSGPDCAQQRTIAAELAADPAFGAVGPSAGDSWTSVPCEENSGGSLVTAGQRYQLPAPVAYDGVLALAAAVAGTGSWQESARISPADKGSSGNARVCYQAGDRYLTVQTDAPVLAPTASPDREFSAIVVEVSQSSQAVDICPTV